MNKNAPSADNPIATRSTTRDPRGAAGSGKPDSPLPKAFDLNKGKGKAKAILSTSAFYFDRFVDC